MRCEHGWDAPQFCLRCLEAERDALKLQNREMKDALEAIAKACEGANGTALLGIGIVARRCLSYTEKRDGPALKEWHCAKCGKQMQFRDGMCWDCSKGDPGS